MKIYLKMILFDMKVKEKLVP
ncbi:hypothetical protein A3Q56_08182 [Intoshia linei]|uniref:Uncharacterized protein n=1 Tax=Intoshia linei TaxID=1819745 RepID=A0A177AS99_9BILA|nr:hypothetical protein A3Q56_08182 [Intoshia linei]